MRQEFKYDLAISFLFQDENLAKEIEVEISKYAKVFFFPKKQKEVAARDGVDIFSEVFLKEARVNLVLYRQRWGKTNWTRVEESAIKQRTFFDSEERATNKWNELIFVNLDKSEVPSWVPPLYVYLDYSSYGFMELIGVIKRRIEELGGLLEEEGYLDVAKRLQAEQALHKELEQYINSEKALLDARKEAEQVLSIFENSYKEFRDYGTGYPFGEFKKSTFHNTFAVGGAHVHIKWNQYLVNTVEHSTLELIIYSMPTNYRRRYAFVINSRKELGWKLKQIGDTRGWYDASNEEHEFIPSKELVEFWMKELVNTISEKK